MATNYPPFGDGGLYNTIVYNGVVDDGISKGPGEFKDGQTKWTP